LKASEEALRVAIKANESTELTLQGARKRVANARVAYKLATKHQAKTELMVPKHPVTGKPIRAKKSTHLHVKLHAKATAEAKK